MNCKANLSFIYYLIVYTIILAFVAVNPDIGRDYQSYVRIVGEISQDQYFKEPGFYAMTKALLFFGVSPEGIVLVFRAIMLLMLFRFFYYNKYKYFGLIFLVFVPNILIGSLNAMQTWLSIAIFAQLFVNSKVSTTPYSYQKLLLVSLVSFSVHYAAIIYLLISLSFIFIKRFGYFTAILASSLVISFLLYTNESIFKYIGYLKYIGNEVTIKTFLFGVVILIILFTGAVKSTRQDLSVFFGSMAYVWLLLFIIFLIIGVEPSIYLRLLNFFIPFIWISFCISIMTFNAELRVVIFTIAFILILLNFSITMKNLSHDMFNIDHIRTIF
jgi:hypothetical protein